LPWSGFVAVAAGATVGAWLRWALGTWLNPLVPAIPLGTLSANLLGGLMIGAVLGASDPTGVPPLLRLLIVTGFLGGLTTFATFSAETTTLLVQARFGWALAAICLHVAGSLALTTFALLVTRAYFGR
jgi:CrcB protein